MHRTAQRTADIARSIKLRSPLWQRRHAAGASINRSPQNGQGANAGGQSPDSDSSGDCQKKASHRGQDWRDSKVQPGGHGRVLYQGTFYSRYQHGPWPLTGSSRRRQETGLVRLRAARLGGIARTSAIRWSNSSARCHAGVFAVQCWVPGAACRESSDAVCLFHSPASKRPFSSCPPRPPAPQGLCLSFGQNKSDVGRSDWPALRGLQVAVAGSEYSRITVHSALPYGDRACQSDGGGRAGSPTRN